MRRRWIRLFPAMLVASLLVFVSSYLFNEGPRGPLQVINLLPGLTFIDSRWWSGLIGQHFDGIEFAFWSLYVEMKFYVFAALIYFFKGRNALL